MAKNVDDIIKNLSPARRKKVETSAAELIAEEMTLQELRRAQRLTQVRMAKKLGVAQKQISYIEKRTDTHISTLRRAIEAMGGRLSLTAEFPNRQPIVLAGLSKIDVNQSRETKAS